MAISSTVEAFLSRVLNISTILVCVAIVYQIGVYIYNIFFHPLHKFPGPLVCAASCLPRIRQALAGNEIKWIISLHEKYGEVVRVKPGELSFSSADAWKAIYGHKRAGEPEFVKDPKFYRSPGPDNDGNAQITSADKFVHARIRKVFSNAFSDKALKMQESLFLTYVDKLISKMREQYNADPQIKFNMVRMYNFTTFDVMGDLTFGEPLGMLDNSDYHPWVANMFANFHFGTYVHSIRNYPTLEALLMKMIPQSLKEKQREHREFSSARVDRRLEKENARPDIWGLVLARDEESGLSKEEMYANASLFMIGGTETTATLLSGLTYHLLKNPDKLRILTNEIRSAFNKEEDITIERLQTLKYLHACLEEGLRMYPPISNGLPRIVPDRGAEIAGQTIPGGATVAVTQLAAYRNPRNFKEPYSFIPERWISKEYAEEKKQAFNPFSTGPRNCLGRNMAYHEMRLILSKVLWNFDLKLCPESDNWADQKIFLLWDKTPLICQITPVSR